VFSLHSYDERTTKIDIINGKPIWRECSRGTMEKLRKYALRNGYKYIIT
jgi:hypothetical protein